ncbi:TetR/AcrR family transcriptional regulator [Actinoplanes regularis]|uniref:Transcriptional regulator, TetR family n=1 Tax=Actinoplanes regularis TaxID=52697 RepID=A0A239CNW7_9ACTN|nr:TetR/AcrR family transcriptional regulator [Actinoplanes regularis]GIE88647.1 transcriptional regulator [Actinoplanes regularis]SNS21956.1 transcriptional regulator, TetR family [Actinoplanes regularis]
MPRQGLTTERVSAAAAELADSLGLERLTVAAVARHFGVADASLYGHVRNREALLHQVAVRAAAAFADRLALAVAGRSGRQALIGFADAYRAFAVTHPGQYAATQLQLPPEVGRNSSGHLRMIELSYATLRGYGLVEPDLTDAIRLLRSTLHGFATLQTADGFGHPRDLDTSWRRVLDAIHVALGNWPTADEEER